MYLAEKGFGRDQLVEIQEIIGAAKSGLFNVLAHIADARLRLKYRDSIADAIADLGRPEDIGRVFACFQKYLYLQHAVA